MLCDTIHSQYVVHINSILISLEVWLLIKLIIYDGVIFQPLFNKAVKYNNYVM